MGFQFYETYVGEMYLDLLADAYSQQRVYQVYERDKTDIVERYLDPGMTFLDIGANQGWFTLLGAECVGTQGRVFAFEPCDETNGQLRQSITQNDIEDTVVLSHFALGDKNDDEVPLYHAFSSGSHSVIDYEGRGTRGHETIKMRTLDEYWKDQCGKIHMVKIDVEGAESAVLAGGAHTLSKQEKCMILMDVHVKTHGVPMEPIIEQLESWGYEVTTETGIPIEKRKPSCRALVAKKGLWEPKKLPLERFRDYVQSKKKEKRL